MEVTNPEFEMEVSPAKADSGDKLGSNVDSVDAIDDARKNASRSNNSSPPAKRRDISMYSVILINQTRFPTH